MSLYNVLNIPKEATALEIKKAYRSCTQIYHTEKGSFPVDSRVAKLYKRYGEEPIFSLIQQSYNILSDPETRALYDAGEQIDDLDYKLLQDIFGTQTNFK
jgi:DnaJ-class molecular chaperone